MKAAEIETKFRLDQSCFHKIMNQDSQNQSNRQTYQDENIYAHLGALQHYGGSVWQDHHQEAIAFHQETYVDCYGFEHFSVEC